MGAHLRELDDYGDRLPWAVLDAAPDGVLLVSGDGVVAFANSRAGELFGREPSDLVGTSVESLMPDDVRERHEKHRQGFTSAPMPRTMGVGLRLRALRHDGSELPVDISLSPLQLSSETYVVASIRDTTERRRLDDELQARDQALRSAEQQMAIAEDRTRIARDLHDTVIQRLFGAGLNLQAIAGTAAPEQGSKIEKVIDELDATIRELRAAIFSLQEPPVESGGIKSRILAVVTDTTSPLGFEPRITFEGAIEQIPAAILEQLLPTIREALSNVVQHSRAADVEVCLTVDDQVTLQVIDDGVGFSNDHRGRGLPNMAHRASARGGTFRTSTAPGRTALTWQVPTEAPA